MHSCAEGYAPLMSHIRKRLLSLLCSHRATQLAQRKQRLSLTPRLGIPPAGTKQAEWARTRSSHQPPAEGTCWGQGQGVARVQYTPVISSWQMVIGGDHSQLMQVKSNVGAAL